MDRRKLLAAIGASSLTSLSGCQVFSSVVRTGPPHFEEVKLDGPSEVVVGEEFSLTVSAKNTGGKKGDFTNTLTVGEGAFSSERNVKIEDIGVTKTKSVEIEPYQIGYAGEYKFRITDYGASQTVSVATKTLDSENELNLENGPTISITDTTLRQSVAYPTDSGTELLTPSSDRVLAFIHLSISNGGDSNLYAGPDSFTVENGEQITELGTYSASLKDLREIDGQPLSTDTVLPDESKSGWILTEVSPETAKNGIRVSWNRDSESSDPEAEWSLSSSEVPQYEVADMTFPSEVEIGTSAEATITIENTGTASGTYHGILERRNTGETEWHRFSTFSLDLDAGASKSWSTEIQEPYVGASQYRLRPGSVTRSIDFVPAARSFEQAYTTPAGSKILVNVGGFNFNGFSSSYSYEGAWENPTVEAESGQQFVFVKISAENTANEAIESPSRDAFSVVVGGDAHSPEKSQTYTTMELVSPLQGTEYSPGWTYSSGETQSGWLIFEIPDDVTKDDLTVRYSPNEKITAKWSVQ